MSKKISIILLLLCLGLFSQAQSYQKISQGVKTTVQGMDVEVAFYSPSIVRVYKTPEGSSYDKKSLVFYYQDDKELDMEIEVSKDEYYEYCLACEVDPRMSVSKCQCVDAEWMDLQLKEE